jgi:hypothetical protein
MSTIKSDSADLTLNCDGASSSLKIQIDGTEKASISSAGLFSSTSIDSTKLVGALPILDGSALTGTGSPSITDNGNATAITINSSEQVGIGGSHSPDTPLHVKIDNNNTLNISNGDAARYYGAKIENTNSTQWAMAPLAFRVAGADSLIIGFKDSASANTGGLSFFTDGGTPSEKLRILSGGGITFNGDTATANALSDYETGSWTPSPQNCTGSALDAKYTKIGDVVHIWGRFNFTGASGEISFLGLPYSPANNQVGGSIMLTGANISGGSTYNVIIYFTTTPRILIYRSEDNSAWDTMSHSHIGNGDQMIFNGFYKV